MEDVQGTTIRLPDCLEQSIFGSGNHDLQKELPNWASSNHKKACTNLITQVTNIKNYVLVSYKPSTYSNFLTLHICFVVWASSFMAKPKRKLLQPEAVGLFPMVTIMWILSFCVTCVRHNIPNCAQDATHYAILQLSFEISSGNLWGNFIENLNFGKHIKLPEKNIYEC